MPVFAQFEYGKKNVISGSDAAAIAATLCKPKVVPIYPVTPQTIIVERIAQMVNDGEYNAEVIRADGEFAVASMLLGAQAFGVRTFSGTSSQGLALMHEVLHTISGMRLPVVMAVANRALSAPINIWNDHQDSMSQRDTGWIQIHCETNQEIFDTTIQAYKIAENTGVRLPVMVCMDGFVLTHLYEPVEVLTQADVDSFLPPYEPDFTLDPKKPVTIGPISAPDSFMDFKKYQEDAINESLNVIKSVNKEFKDKFGRGYGNGLVENYKVENADIVLVAMGSVCGTIKEFIDNTDAKIGLLRIKSFRPFPINDVKAALKDAEKIAVIDRAAGLGNNGPLFTEVKSASGRKKINNFIAGLGGRLVTEDDIDFIIEHAGESVNYWVNCNA